MPLKTYREIYLELGGDTKFIWFVLAEQAGKIYAEQVAVDVRERCRQNAEVNGEGRGILETEIILP